MKHFKLFLMTLLLCVGVSSAWAGTATEEYDVEYVGRTVEQGAGYNINRYYSEPTWTQWSYTEGIDAGSSTPILIVMKNGRSQSGAPAVTDLTSSNFSTYFSPITLSGYVYRVDITAPSGSSRGKITITYETHVVDYEDGDFIYSQTYVQSTGNTIELTGNEIAIALNLKVEEEVTDTIMINSRWIGNTQLTNTVGSSTEAADNDNDGAGTTAIYKYLGRKTNFGYNDRTDYMYLRTHKVWASRLEHAVIPATVTIDGTPYTVVAIQKFGFNYRKHCVVERYQCSDTSDEPISFDYFEYDHSNDYLKTVSFEAPENIKYIGDYAFTAGRALKSVVVPKNVEYLGTGAFACCFDLEDVLFQVDETTRLSKVSKISNFTFWYCTSIKSLELPAGIKVIEGTARGAAMQYMTSLTLIRLPNTLETVGSHFLCCASSLKELTIPASVTSFDGAAFHGCESLRDVYLLGTAASLEPGGADATFGANHNLCKDHVHDCTFWTTPDYIDDYKNDEVWCLIDEKGLKDGTTYNNGYYDVTCTYGNKLSQIEEEKRTFEGGKWVTAIFPNGVSNYKNSVFGAKTRVARPYSATSTATGEAIVYNVTFKLIDTDDIPAGVPVMFCPENTVTDYVMITTANMADPEFKLHMTDEHSVDPIAVDDGAVISMMGQYKDHRLLKWNFYFMYKNNKASFYRVADPDKAPQIKSTRCYWRIDISGLISSSNGLGAKQSFFDIDETPSGIDNAKDVRIKVTDVYDINGHKLNVNPDNLPQGMFIVNGKKVLVK